MAKKNLNLNALDKKKEIPDIPTDKGAKEEVVQKAGKKSHVPKDKRKKIMVTIEEELLQRVDIELLTNKGLKELLGKSVNRSHLISIALADYLARYKDD